MDEAWKIIYHNKLSATGPDTGRVLGKSICCLRINEDTESNTERCIILLKLIESWFQLVELSVVWENNLNNVRI